MNSKTCKTLRRTAGYKPSKMKTVYAWFKSIGKWTNKESNYLTVKSDSPRGVYRELKKHYKAVR